jgi:type VI protein secretion system component Hcp
MNQPFAIARLFMVLCAIGLNAACTYGPGVEEEYSKSLPVGARAEVHIHVANAQVHVSTSEDSKVDFHVRYETSDSDSAPPFRARQDGNVIELTENEGSRDWWSWDSSGVERAMVEVRMPKNADLQLQTSNGAIEVSSVNGNIHLRTSNGAINADGLQGKLQASSSNGAISVEGGDGDCEISTSNGRIRVEGRFDSLEIHSSNGGVEARATAGSTVASHWTISTSNAAVDLSLPSDLKADLDVGTSNGGVQLELPVTVQGVQDQSHLHGTLNGGGQEVSVHTSNGRIHLSGV